MVNQEPIDVFLGARTPSSWFEQAPNNLGCLLIDHAHCERKAAQFALKMLSAYPDRAELVQVVSRLAREELVHFERVLRLIREHGFQYKHLSASNYASHLMSLLSVESDERLVQQLIIAAFIEARSCERFWGLQPYLDASLGAFYKKLAVAESRHYETYIRLAQMYSDSSYVSKWASTCRVHENIFITAQAKHFRFHGGPL